MKLLTREEALKFLDETWHGVLALVDEGKPYCFPTAHVLHGDSLFFLFLKYGRKTRCIEKNPHGCYLVYEIRDGNCYSVIVEGTIIREENPDTIRQVLDLYYRKVFPYDPYFKDLLNVQDIVERLYQHCIEKKIPGIYRMVISSISGVVH